MITHYLTYGEMKICLPIKSSQNIIYVIIKDDLRDIEEVSYEAAFNLQHMADLQKGKEFIKTL